MIRRSLGYIRGRLVDFGGGVLLLLCRFRYQLKAELPVGWHWGNSDQADLNDGMSPDDQEVCQ